MSNLLRHLPAVHELLAHEALQGPASAAGHAALARAVRQVLDRLREEIQAGRCNAVPGPDELAAAAVAALHDQQRATLRPVINATGILLHTGLGRAPLAEEAIEALVAVARGYANVELDLASGQRSQRKVAVEGLLCELTGAEAALVVNNNAGATLLALAATAAGREVIVSRGQLIEIGGSFRLPDVMAASGALLREVGTTNKTRLGDYAAAINDRTAALLLVHPSNFQVVGFTESVDLPALVRLGRERGISVIHDIGSGALVDFTPFGFQDEPLAAESLRAGADVVLFSGDKLLGGPQAGILLGRRGPLEAIGQHPLARALRVDKLTLAALEATLRLYRDPQQARQKIPLLKLLTTPLETLRGRAERLAAALAATRSVARAEALADVTFLGGGSLPAQQLGTWCVAVTPAEGSAEALAQRLRSGQPPIVGRLRQDRLLLDLRSVFPAEDEPIAAAFGV